MRYPFLFAAIAILLLSFGRTSFATTQWNLGVSIGNEGINAFHLSVGEYYRVPEAEGRQFVAINDSTQKEKHDKNGKHKGNDFDHDDDDRGKGKDRDDKHAGKGKGKK
jgi:hypothetical protein